MSTGNKDLWDRFSVLSTFLSTVVIAIIGLYFTYSYNSLESQRKADFDKQEVATKEYQNKILEMQTMEKFIPYLASKDEGTKKIATLTISTLASPTLAMNIAQLYKSKGTKEAVDVIMASTHMTEKLSYATQAGTFGDLFKTTKGVEPIVSEKSGWIYLGDYDVLKKQWNTMYLSFKGEPKPDELVNKSFPVSDITGDINLREGMPKDSGEFPPVKKLLKPKTNVNIVETKQWLTTGYIWAKVTYSD